MSEIDRTTIKIEGDNTELVAKLGEAKAAVSDLKKDVESVSAPTIQGDSASASAADADADRLRINKEISDSLEDQVDQTLNVAGNAATIAQNMDRAAVGSDMMAKGLRSGISGLGLEAAAIGAVAKLTYETIAAIGPLLEQYADKLAATAVAVNNIQLTDIEKALVAIAYPVKSAVTDLAKMNAEIEKQVDAAKDKAVADAKAKGVSEDELKIIERAAEIEKIRLKNRAGEILAGKQRLADIDKSVKAQSDADKNAIFMQNYRIQRERGDFELSAEKKKELLDKTNEQRAANDLEALDGIQKINEEERRELAATVAIQKDIEHEANKKIVDGYISEIKRKYALRRDAEQKRMDDELKKEKEHADKIASAHASAMERAMKSALRDVRNDAAAAFPTDQIATHFGAMADSLRVIEARMLAGLSN